MVQQAWLSSALSRAPRCGHLPWAQPHSPTYNNIGQVQVNLALQPVSTVNEWHDIVLCMIVETG